MKNDVLPIIVAAFSIFLLILVILVYWSGHFKEMKMWQEAERRGYAVKLEHSGGTGYKWKDE